MRRFVGGVAVAVALVVLGTGLLRWRELGSLLVCEDSRVLEVPSPDGRFVATVLERNCGATAGFVTRVRLTRPGRPLGLGAQTAVQYSGRAGGAAGPVVAVRWHLLPARPRPSPEGTVGDEVVIEYPCEPTRVDARRWNGVFIRARHLDSLPQTVCARERRAGPTTWTNASTTAL